MEELLKRIKHKDEEAFEEIVNMFQRQLLIIATFRLGDKEFADDAVQDTFLSLFNNCKKIKDANKMKAWLTKVLINKCNKIIKQNKNFKISFELNYFENYIYEEDSYKNIHDEIDFYNRLNVLDTEERTIIAMFYGESYSLKEISEILNINVGTLKSKISRAKSKLKDKIGGEF